MRKKLLFYGILSALLLTNTSAIYATQTEDIEYLTESENEVTGDNDSEMTEDNEDIEGNEDNVAYSAGWQDTDSGLKWQTEDGSYASDTWIETDGKKYYLDSDGTMYIGWLFLDSNWYYLNEDGTLAVNTWIGKYYVDSNGIWDSTKQYHVPGWKHTVSVGGGKMKMVHIRFLL